MVLHWSYFKSRPAVTGDLFSEFKNSRNGHEARRIAQVLDALVRLNIDYDTDAMEICVRILMGLCQADTFSDPSYLDVMEWAPPTDPMPRELLRQFQKGVKRRAQLKKSSATTPAPNMAAGGGRG